MGRPDRFTVFFGRRVDFGTGERLARVRCSSGDLPLLKGEELRPNRVRVTRLLPELLSHLFRIDRSTARWGGDHGHSSSSILEVSAILLAGLARP